MRLLEQLKEQATPAFIQMLFTQMAEDMASDYRSDVDNLNLEQRLEIVRKLLSREGFSVEVEKHGDFFHIRESSCPYFHIGQDHPEVCSVDQTLISTLLNIPAQKVQCLLQGDAVCTYIIPNEIIRDADLKKLETAKVA